MCVCVCVYESFGRARRTRASRRTSCSEPEPRPRCSSSTSSLVAPPVGTNSGVAPVQPPAGLVSGHKPFSVLSPAAARDSPSPSYPVVAALATFLGAVVLQQLFTFSCRGGDNCFDAKEKKLVMLDGKVDDETRRTRRVMGWSFSVLVSLVAHVAGSSSTKVRTEVLPQ